MICWEHATAGAAEVQLRAGYQSNCAASCRVFWKDMPATCKPGNGKVQLEAAVYCRTSKCRVLTILCDPRWLLKLNCGTHYI